MIDPKLLTPANGFEDGVVVEIVWEGGSRSWEPFKGAEYWLPGD